MQMAGRFPELVTGPENSSHSNVCTSLRVNDKRQDGAVANDPGDFLERKCPASSDGTRNMSLKTNATGIVIVSAAFPRKCYRRLERLSEEFVKSGTRTK